MRRMIGIVFSVILFFGAASAANAQQEVIDNLKIVSIKSVQVRDKDDSGNKLDYIYLDVQTNITNSNERELRLRKGTFNFYASATYRRDAAKKEVICKGENISQG